MKPKQCIIVMTITTCACVSLTSATITTNAVMNEDKLVGVWKFSKIESQTESVIGRLLHERAVGLTGAQIYCYTQGVAEICLQNGKRSAGFSFLDEPHQSVTFLFDGNVGSCGPLLLLEGHLLGTNKLVFNVHGQLTITLVNRDRCPPVVPNAVRKRVDERKKMTLAQVLEQTLTTEQKIILAHPVKCRDEASLKPSRNRRCMDQEVDANGNAIFSAVYDGNIRKTTELLDANPKLVVVRNYYAQTPLHVAASRGHKDIAELLLVRGTEINARDADGVSPLHEAVLEGRTNLVKLLMVRNADVSVKDKVYITVMFGEMSKAKEILDSNSVLLYGKDQEIGTWLHWTAKCGYVEFARLLLLSYKFDVNAKDDLGLTPLHWAAVEGQKNMTEFLLANNANVNDCGSTSNGNVTPLHLASHLGRFGVVELLVRNGATINARDCNGSTPWRSAAEWGHKDVAELLKKYGGHQ